MLYVVTCYLCYYICIYLKFKHTSIVSKPSVPVSRYRLVELLLKKYYNTLKIEPMEGLCELKYTCIYNQTNILSMLRHTIEIL